MFEKKCYIGKVVDNNSPDLDGRVKIKIEEIHYDIADADCPWFKQDRSITSNIPEVNDIVWCYFVDDFFKKGFYCNKVNLEAYHSHKYFNDNVKSAVGSNSTYPNMKFDSYANGVTIGVDSSASNPEIVIFHPQASIFIDKIGKLKVIMKDNGSIKSDKDFTIEAGGGNKIEVTSTGVDIKVPGKKFKMNGTVTGANGQGGFCGLPTCLFTGAPHVTNEITGV